MNEEYTPSEEEVAYARKVIQMDKEAQAAGRGSFQIDGKMIDIPVVVRAERLIRRYEAIKAREAKTLAAARRARDDRDRLSLPRPPRTARAQYRSRVADACEDIRPAQSASSRSSPACTSTDILARIIARRLRG